MILKELRLIRMALESVAPKRWQKIPEASITLNTPQSTLRSWADNNMIPVMVRTRTKVRKQYLVDVVKTRIMMEDGGLLPKVRKH